MVHHTLSVKGQIKSRIYKRLMEICCPNIAAMRTHFPEACTYGFSHDLIPWITRYMTVGSIGVDLNPTIRAFINALPASYIAGSFVLQAYLGEEWSGSDIDIWISAAEPRRYTISNIEKYMMTIGYIRKNSEWSIGRIPEEYTRMRSIRDVVTFVDAAVNATTTVRPAFQFLFTQQVRETIHTFDIAACRMVFPIHDRFYNNTIFDDDMREALVDIDQREIKFTEAAQAQNSCEWLRSGCRAIKYINRGFTISPDEWVRGMNPSLKRMLDPKQQLYHETHPKEAALHVARDVENFIRKWNTQVVPTPSLSMMGIPTITWNGGLNALEMHFDTRLHQSWHPTIIIQITDHINLLRQMRQMVSVPPPPRRQTPVVAADAAVEAAAAAVLYIPLPPANPQDGFHPNDNQSRWEKRINWVYVEDQVFDAYSSLDIACRVASRRGWDYIAKVHTSRAKWRREVMVLNHLKPHQICPEIGGIWEMRFNDGNQRFIIVMERFDDTLASFVRRGKALEQHFECAGELACTMDKLKESWPCHRHMWNINSIVLRRESDGGYRMALTVNNRHIEDDDVDISSESHNHHNRNSSSRLHTLYYNVSTCQYRAQLRLAHATMEATAATSASASSVLQHSPSKKQRLRRE